MDIYSEKKAVKDLNSLYAEAVYGKPKSAGQELASRENKDDAAGAPKKMVVTRADKKANTPAYQNYKKGVKGYAAADHLKNEEYGELYSHVYNKELQEKQKDTPDQVKAVIAYDKARKGTDDATYDSEHGDKKQAKKERDYAKWQRDKGAEDAQKSGHPWEHAKGSTREKEGKKSEKHAHIKDSFSNWKDDLREVLTATQKQDEKEVVEKKVKNKVIIDPKINLEQILGGEVEVIEDYETKKKGEVLSALKKRDLDKKTKNKIADDIVKRKGDTSKSDDRYAYEGYQRNPEEDKDLKIKEEILLDRAVVALSEMNIDEDIADIIARLEKKRISKGGNPDDSPLPAMKKYHADKKKKAAKAEK